MPQSASIIAAVAVTIFVKHPLYTSVALLVLPWLGFLLDTWLGALIGIVLYVASRLLAPGEEADLADQFGPGVGRLLPSRQGPAVVMAELWRMSTTQLAALIRDRKVSVREVIETHLRIDAVNPALNAIVIRLDEQALAAIPVGRTNLATFTVRWHCESELRGHTINPWDATRTPAHPAAAMQASSGETRPRPGVTG